MIFFNAIISIIVRRRNQQKNTNHKSSSNALNYTYYLEFTNKALKPYSAVRKRTPKTIAKSNLTFKLNNIIASFNSNHYSFGKMKLWVEWRPRDNMVNVSFIFNNPINRIRFCSVVKLLIEVSEFYYNI